MLRKFFSPRLSSTESKAACRNPSSRWSDSLPAKVTVQVVYCIGLLSLLTTSLGCALCCSPDDYNYGTYGGRWQRHDMSSGRVSSAFAEAGYDSLGNSFDGQPAAEPELLSGDEHIRPVSYDEVSSYIE